MAVLLMVRSVLTLRPKRQDLKQHAEEGEDESEKDECLVGVLPGAGQTGGREEGAFEPVVVLGREDESR